MHYSTALAAVMAIAPIVNAHGVKRASKVSPDATCGGQNGYTCLGSTFGNCCSSAGWCGSTTAYCGTGCNNSWGTCTGSSPSSAKASSILVASTSKPATKTSSVATSATRTASAFATPTGLQNWVVNSVGSYSPGERAAPWLSITGSVTDPNTYNLGTGSDGGAVIIPAGSQGSNCKAQWLGGESPVGRSWRCDSSDGYGYWTMHVLDNGSPASTEGFKLTFTRYIQTLYGGSSFEAKYEATGAFAVGDNMSGVCGGSGVCSWDLKQPIMVAPKKD